MKNRSDLSARQRIEAALKLHHSEFPGVSISITALCRMASVNRAGLYEHHRDLINEIKNNGKPSVRKERTAAVSTSDLKRQLVQEKKRTSALHYLCVELLAKIQRLERKIALNS